MVEERVSKLESQMTEILALSREASTRSKGALTRDAVVKIGTAALIALAGWAVKVSISVEGLRQSMSSTPTHADIYALESRLHAEFNAQFPQPWLKEAVQRIEKKVDTVSDKAGAIDVRLTRVESKIENK